MTPDISRNSQMKENRIVVSGMKFKLHHRSDSNFGFPFSTRILPTQYATEVAEKLKIKGWIMLNKRGVIRSQIEGEKDKVDEM